MTEDNKDIPPVEPKPVVNVTFGSGASGEGTAASTADVPETGPLTPVFLVWPGKRMSQLWVFFWFGLAYVAAALLPWQGEWGHKLVTATGEAIPAYEVAFNLADTGASVDVVGAIEPGMGFGALLTLLCGLGLVLTGIMNIWNRRLVLWPVTLSWFVIAAILWFTNAEYFVPADAAAGTAATQSEIGIFAQVGDLLGHWKGLFYADQAEAMGEVARRFGLGAYMALLTQAVLFLFIVVTVIIALFTTPKSPPQPMGGKRRPGQRR